MKKILTILCFLMSSPAFAGLAEVKSVDNFSTENPPKIIRIEAIKNFELSRGVDIHKGNILEGTISVKPPRIFKRNSSFIFYPSEYSNGNGVVKLSQKYKGKYLKPIDKGNAAKKAALTVGNKFVPGISIGYNLVEGAVENPEGNRTISAVKSAYENSFLTFYKKGKYIEIKNGDTFYLYFRKL